MNDQYHNSSMKFWWPLVQDLEVPMPRTHIIEAPEMYRWFWQVADMGDDETPPKPPGYDAVVAAVEDLGGAPVFLRTDQASMKHEWATTCFVSNASRIDTHMFAMLEWHEMVWAPTANAWVVREFLKSAEVFRAFGGWGCQSHEEQMPIGPERRYFVRDGVVECHHAYWPAESIVLPTVVCWEPLLDQANTEGDEVALLTQYATLIGSRLLGWWSLDFMLTADGTWYFIDAAEGQDSWHTPECPFAPEVDNADYESPVQE